MSLVRWDPFREFRPLFRTGISPLDFVGEDWSSSFPVDVYEEADKVVVKSDLPGFDPEEVEISVSDDMVTIEAQKKQEQENEDKDRNYLRRERFYSRCARTISLPAPVKAEEADAVFEKGTLKLSLPKMEEVKPKQVKIRIDSQNK